METLDVGDGSLDEFRTQAARAKRVPTFEAKFRNLRLNQRVSVDEKWISGEAWQACRADVDLDALVGDQLLKAVRETLAESVS